MDKPVHVSRRALADALSRSLPAVVMVTATPAAAVSAPGAQWLLLGTHPQAASQPTAIGQRILDLELLKGRLYAGFGDYGANTGPRE